MNRLSWATVLRGCWKGGLGLSLGLAVSGASAEEIEWRAAADARPAGAGPRRVIASTAPAAPAPAVSVLAPLPLPAGSGAVKPVSFSTGTGPESRVVFRAQMSDAPRMMPVGLPDGPGDPPAKKGWEGPPASRDLPALTPESLHPLPHAGLPPGDPCACGPCPCGPCVGDPCPVGHPDGRGWFWSREFGEPDNHRFWVSGEYLLWWVQGEKLPPLVTLGSVADPLPGALGQPGTRVLFGGNIADENPRSGARFRAGWWFDDEHLIGIDAAAFFLAQRTVNFSAGSPAAALIARPFSNPGVAVAPDGTVTAVGKNGQPLPSHPDSEIVSSPPSLAFPQGIVGVVSVGLTSRLWGYEANLRTSLGRTSCWNLDLLGGFRGIGLDETLQVSETVYTPSHLVSNPATSGLVFTPIPEVNVVQDRFQTQNRFYGGQVGLEGTMRWGAWSVNLSGKVALGTNHETVTILGSTVNSASGVQPGGLLALPTQGVGHYTRDVFAVAPEGAFNVGYQLTEGVRVFAGYNFLYLSNVARPGAQIDPRVNPSFLPFGPTSQQGPAVPMFAFKSTDLWAQGLNLGLEFRW